MTDIRISSQQNLTPLDLSTDATQIQDAGQQEMPRDLVAQMQLEGQRILAQLKNGVPELPEPKSGKPGGEKTDLALNEASTQLHADIFQFMALFMKFAQEMRQTARLDREMTLQAQVDSLQAAAEEMRTAATQRFNAALAQGICQIGAGAIQIGGAAASLKQTNGAIKEGISTDVGKGLMAKGDAYNMIGRGVGEVVNGMGTIARGAEEQKAGETDARRSEEEAAARIHEAARDKAKETMDMMMDIIRDIRDKLAAIEQSNVEANRGIARNI